MRVCIYVSTYVRTYVYVCRHVCMSTCTITYKLYIYIMYMLWHKLPQARNHVLICKALMSQVLVNLWLSCPAFRQTRAAKATPSPRKAQPQIDFAGPRAPYYGCRVFFRRSLGPRGLHGLVVRWCHWCGVPSYKFRVVQHAWSMVM